MLSYVHYAFTKMHSRIPSIRPKHLTKDSEVPVESVVAERAVNHANAWT